MSPAARITAWVLAGVTLTCMVAAAMAWMHYQRFLDRSLVQAPDGLVFEVHPGNTPADVVKRLERRGITRDDWRWRLLFRLRPVTIQAGEFRLPEGTTPGSMLELLESGDVIQHRFTIVEGWTYRQLAAGLQAEPRLAVEPAQLAENAVMAVIGSDATHPEGWFLPETYAWVAGDTALDLLRRAHGAMRRALEAEWSDRDPDIPLDEPYDLLILASIVEKESSVADELPHIAGVFTRRLEHRWRLETDPTIIYGLGEGFDGDIRTRDLRTDNPYNTYTRHGLPPTPIALPGRAALAAAARPATGTAMFFVADGAGGHVFSDTLEEHERAVRAYLDRRRNAN